MFDDQGLVGARFRQTAAAVIFGQMLPASPNESVAYAQHVVRSNWLGMALLRGTALATLIAGYLTAVGVTLRFFSNEFLAFKRQEPVLFWSLLIFPVLFIGCFSVAPEAWRRLVQAKRRALALQASSEGAQAAGYFSLSPYIAIRPGGFKREDGAHERILRWLRASARPVLFLSGMSGSGKTSVVEAYVIPVLRQSGWRIEVLRDYREPLAALEAALAAIQPGTGRLLIILDQFEELIILEDRTSAAERQQFLDRVRGIRASHPPGVTILVIVRSDYLSALIGMKLDELTSDITWVEIDPFHRGPARRFLENAPQAPGPELVNRLLNGAEALDDTPGLYRPVVLNMLGLALEEFDQSVTRRPERLVQAYLQRAVTAPSIKDIAPAIIDRMISSQGTKVPCSLAEVTESTGIAERDVALCMARLEAKSLVRRVNVADGLWEISHDFVARQLAIYLGRLRPTPWPTVATVASPILLLLLLAGSVAAVPMYMRQHASDALRGLGVEVTGSDQLQAKVPGEAKQAIADLGGTFALLSIIGSVKKLELGDTPITDLRALRALSGLQELDLSTTQVVNLGPLSELTALQVLDLSRTKLTDLHPLHGLPALQELDISSTNVVDLSPLNGCKALRVLNVSFTPLTALGPLNGLPALQELDLSLTRVTDLRPLRELSNLRELDLTHTPVVDVAELNGLRNLRSLRLNETDVSELTPLHELAALEELHLPHTRVVNLSALEGIPGLAVLDLSYTNIADLGPLKRASALESLYLIHTKVTDLGPLTGLPKLQTLDLSDTLVSDLAPLKTLPALRDLRLLVGPALLSRIRTQIEDLRARHVIITSDD